MKFEFSTAYIGELLDCGVYGSFMENWDVSERYEEFTNEICRAASDCIECIVKDIMDDFDYPIEVTDLKFVSPKYYNFTNDTVECIINMPDNSVEYVLKYISEHRDFFKEAKKSFGSRDGFFSFMPYEKDDFIKALNGADVGRAMGIFLTYAYKHSGHDLENIQELFDNTMLLTDFYEFEED